MSKLYAIVITDAIKTDRKARAHEWIQVKLHYDEKDYKKICFVGLEINKETGKPELFVDNEKIKEFDI